MSNVERIAPVKSKFDKEFDVMTKCVGCGIGVSGGAKSLESGITLYFETQEQMDAFPYKEDRYDGVLIHRTVTGCISAASTV